MNVFDNIFLLFVLFLRIFVGIIYESVSIYKYMYDCTDFYVIYIMCM